MRTTLRVLMIAARVSVTVARWLFVASKLTARLTVAAAIVAEDAATTAISEHTARRAELAAAAQAERPELATAPQPRRAHARATAGKASA